MPERGKLVVGELARNHAREPGRVALGSNRERAADKVGPPEIGDGGGFGLPVDIEAEEAGGEIGDNGDGVEAAVGEAGGALRSATDLAGTVGTECSYNGEPLGVGGEDKIVAARLTEAEERQ